jgi:DNA-binding MarR family transcriptional regulator
MSTTSVRRPARRVPPLVGALLRFGWQRVRTRMAGALQQAGFTDLQDAHLSVFQYPGPQGLRPSDLARQMRVSRQAANHLIVQLETFGYLERRARARGDRRRVYLTPRGEAVMATLKASVREFERELEAEVGSARFRAFLEVLERCAGPTRPVA